jgi:hypothetical protein
MCYIETPLSHLLQVVGLVLDQNVSCRGGLLLFTLGSLYKILSSMVTQTKEKISTTPFPLELKTPLLYNLWCKTALSTYTVCTPPPLPNHITIWKVMSTSAIFRLHVGTHLYCQRRRQNPVSKSIYPIFLLLRVCMYTETCFCAKYIIVVTYSLPSDIKRPVHHVQQPVNLQNLTVFSPVGRVRYDK